MSEYKPSKDSEYSNKLQMIYSDSLDNISGQKKMIFVKLAVDLTSSVMTIKQIFSKESSNL